MHVWRRSVTSGLRWEAATVLGCVLLCAGPGLHRLSALTFERTRAPSRAVQGASPDETYFAVLDVADQPVVGESVTNNGNHETIAAP